MAITIPEGPVAVAPTEVGSVRPSWSGGRLARVAHKVVELGFGFGFGGGKEAGGRAEGQITATRAPKRVQGGTDNTESRLVVIHGVMLAGGPL